MIAEAPAPFCLAERIVKNKAGTEVPAVVPTEYQSPSLRSFVGTFPFVPVCKLGEEWSCFVNSLSLIGTELVHRRQEFWMNHARSDICPSISLVLNP